MAGAVQPIGSGEVIVYKPRWGAFYRTGLEKHLRQQNVSTLVFSGCNYPNCPRTSIYQASERDFRIAAAVDAISGIEAADINRLEAIGVSCATSMQIAGVLMPAQQEATHKILCR